jgi:hypothetical protein
MTAPPPVTEARLRGWRPWRGAVRAAAFAGGVAALISGCGSVEINSNIGLPACPTTSGGVSASLVLMAQSVPSATWLPCIRSLPVGWTFSDVHARDGTANFVLDSDREGAAAVRILLDKSCTVSGATEIPSDQPGVRRFERVTRISSGYSGDRYYLSDGGCITYRFKLSGHERAEPVTAVTQALGFVSRDRVRRYIEQHFGGELHLDAGPAGPSQ